MGKRLANSRDSYTIIFRNFCKRDVPDDDITYKELLISQLSSSATTTSISAEELVNMIYAKFANNDINIPTKGINEVYEDSDLTPFIEDVIDVFDKYKTYYSELLTNYNKAYDYATGNKRRTTMENTWNREGETSNTTVSSGEHTEYELPNKVTDVNYKSTPSSIDTDTGNATNTGTNSSTTTGTTETVVTYDNEFLDLKRKYLNQIRNVYEEFADEFKECFYLVYYTDLVKEED